MATPCEALSFPATETSSTPLLSVGLASTDEEIRACQRLRYDIFATEMGAKLETKIPGLDVDHFDSLCKHLLVRDNQTRQVVGTTRLILGNRARQQQHFYSETEFDLSNVLQLPGRFMEVGRTCIHADYRNGSTIAVLWQGLARIMVMHDVDYLIGCASIPLDDGGANAHAVLEHLRRKNFPSHERRVYPYRALPAPAAAHLGAANIPALLKAYLRLGATICGEAYWDTAFNVADVFVLLGRDKIEKRYSRHFVSCKYVSCK